MLDPSVAARRAPILATLTSHGTSRGAAKGAGVVVDGTKRGGTQVEWLVAGAGRGLVRAIPSWNVKERAKAGRVVCSVADSTFPGTSRGCDSIPGVVEFKAPNKISPNKPVVGFQGWRSNIDVGNVMTNTAGALPVKGNNLKGGKDALDYIVWGHILVRRVSRGKSKDLRPNSLLAKGRRHRLPGTIAFV